MSKLTTLIICLLFMCVQSVAQQQTVEPVKNKSNRIILHFNDTTGLFSRFAMLLTDRSYDLEA